MIRKVYLLLPVLIFIGCAEKKKQATIHEVPNLSSSPKLSVIFDTDANNELDDQHALAYLLFNGNTFDVRGITVNATYNGGTIQKHFEEAERVMQLCNLKDSIPLVKGANASFTEITANFDPASFDGQAAVDFMLDQTKKDSLVIVAVGKLTNIALALKKDPSFADRTKIVWLGSNYPEPGEYNQDNDTIAMNYVLHSSIPFEMVTVRYGKPSGTDAVSVTREEINQKMPGLGPRATQAVTGRHGGEFYTFGDYSISLFQHIFEHINHAGETQTRPLFDMVAVAILKNKNWGKARTIPAPVLIENQWVERPRNKRKIVLWEYFDKQALLTDFFNTLEHPIPVSNTK